ncbi:hypothetical protein AAFF_G00341900 [Aldrovandia affinis]|uniref:Uncharacterized protein n=1 Tax=Aldrovandia affinis TaxID=143900 RepID=A0AAD7SKQ4_9TELE|nr:hypothetical protein AAFF_G00341900 [Aldrovandia affinis]
MSGSRRTGSRRAWAGPAEKQRKPALLTSPAPAREVSTKSPPRNRDSALRCQRAGPMAAACGFRLPPLAGTPKTPAAPESLRHPVNKKCHCCCLASLGYAALILFGAQTDSAEESGAPSGRRDGTGRHAGRQ